LKQIGISKKILHSVVLPIWVLCVQACGPGESVGDASGVLPESTTLTLVVVGSFPASAISELGGFVSWLNQGLQDEKLRFEVRVAMSVPEAASWLAAGEADFYLDSPHPILLARHLSDCRLFLNRWKFGTETYRSVIFARRDASLEDLEALRGRTIAFEDRYSASSFFLPVDHLSANGLDGVFLQSPDAAVPEDQAGFVFSGGDSTTIHWVLAGKVGAGALNEWNFKRIADDDRKQLQVLATTGEIPRHILAVRAGLDPAVEARVRELLLSAHESPEGREMLAGFSATERFAAVPEGFNAAIESVQALVVRLDALVSAAEGGAAQGGLTGNGVAEGREP